MSMPTPEQIRERVAKNLERYAAVRSKVAAAADALEMIQREAAVVIEALVFDDVRTVQLVDGRTITFRKNPSKLPGRGMTVKGNACAAEWIEVEKEPAPTLLEVKTAGG